MISEALRTGPAAFDFAKRNRRPPTDPVNALLSFTYSLLVRAWTVTLAAVGFDPFRGLYHQPRYGRPALALDLMEPFRPLLADSVVLQVINNGEVQSNDFRTAAGAVALTPDGRRHLIAAFERRLSHEIVHPLFGYRVSYRRLMEMQAPPPGPLPAGRDSRVSELHDALSPWKSISTSSPTTYPIPGAGGRCSR